MVFIIFVSDIYHILIISWSYLEHILIISLSLCYVIYLSYLHHIFIVSYIFFILIISWSHLHHYLSKLSLYVCSLLSFFSALHFFFSNLGYQRNDGKRTRFPREAFILPALCRFRHCFFPASPHATQICRLLLISSVLHKAKYPIFVNSVVAKKYRVTFPAWYLWGLYNFPRWSYSVSSMGRGVRIAQINLRIAGFCR